MLSWNEFQNCDASGFFRLMHFFGCYRWPASPWGQPRFTWWGATKPAKPTGTRFFFFSSIEIYSRSLQHHAIADLKQTGWGHTQTSYSMLLWKRQMPCPWYIARGLFLCRRVADLSNFIKIRIRLFISMVPDYPRSRPKNSFKKTQKNFLIFLIFFSFLQYVLLYLSESEFYQLTIYF